MLRSFGLLLLVFLVSASTVAAQEDIQQQVLASERQWFNAFYEGDADGVARMETEDFVFIQQGRIIDKPEPTARNRNRGPLLQTRQTTVHRLFLHGDTAVLLGTAVVPQGTEIGRVRLSGSSAGPHSERLGRMRASASSTV